MCSSEEIDWIIEQLGYYVYLEGFYYPEMDSYYRLADDFLYKGKPIYDNDICIEQSEADGETYSFDVSSFKSSVDILIDEMIIETVEMYNLRQHLWRIYMPKYRKQKESDKMLVEVDGKFSVTLEAENLDDALDKVNMMMIIDMDESDLDIYEVKE